MLSMSSAKPVSSSASSEAARSKKEVGGICLGSPTTMTLLPRAMAPIASHTVICEASSKTTRSKCLLPAARNWATESGLMRRQVVSVVRTSPSRSEEHTSELQSLMRSSYAVFCLKKKRIKKSNTTKLVIRKLTRKINKQLQVTHERLQLI